MTKQTEHCPDARLAFEPRVRLPFLFSASGYWVPVRDGHPSLRPFMDAHYSGRKYRDGRSPPKIMGPGQYLALLGMDGMAVLAGRKAIMMDGQEGINGSVFRNEGERTSSEILREGMGLAWDRWPGERLFTYVNAAKVRSRNPGYCFKAAGWRRCGYSAGGLHILDVHPAT